MRTDERLYALASEFVDGMGYQLVDVREVTEHGRRILRFFIDHPRGITLADCESVSRELSYLLDADGEIEGAYSLEVSSPGLDHELMKEREYEHFAGRRARLVLRGDSPGSIVKGTIEGADGGRVRFKPDGGRDLTIELSYIARARLEIPPK